MNDIDQSEKVQIMNQWTENNIPDLTGKIVIITGANNGLGFEASRMMAAKGATVIMAVRTMSKGEAAAKEIRAKVPNAKLEMMQLDLASLDSVRSFAYAFKAKYDRLDILQNNAGVMMTPESTTKDGFEMQFGTNHLGHFALTGLLMDVLTATEGSRIVNVSSLAAERGEMHFNDLMLKQDYGRSKAYGQSKLANLLFTKALNKRLQDNGTNTISVAAHPGVANTNLISSANIPIIAPILKFVFGFMTQSSAVGTLSQVRASVAPDVAGGEYYGPSEGMRGYPAKVEMPSQTTDTSAETLWSISEELTGITYDFGISS